MACLPHYQCVLIWYWVKIPGLLTRPESKTPNSMFLLWVLSGLPVLVIWLGTQLIKASILLCSSKSPFQAWRPVQWHRIWWDNHHSFCGLSLSARWETPCLMVSSNHKSLIGTMASYCRGPEAEPSHNWAGQRLSAEVEGDRRSKPSSKPTFASDCVVPSWVPGQDRNGLFVSLPESKSSTNFSFSAWI